MNGAKQIGYRGFKSTTFCLTILGFVVGTGLLMIDKITAAIWQESVFGLLALYVTRTGIGHIAEAAETYITKMAPAPPPTPQPYAPPPIQPPPAGGQP